MKKKIVYIFLFIFIVIFIMSFKLSLQINNFNENEVMRSINYLSSDVFKGRLAGTFENKICAAYIRDQFKQNGLKPYTKDYYENFPVTFPKLLPGKPFLKVFNNKGNLIKQYVYGTDYKEDMLSFKQNKICFNYNNKITYGSSYIKVSSGGNIFVFYCPENNNISFRSSYSQNSPIALLILISKKTYNDFKNLLADGCSIDCSVPCTESKTNINNVIGYIQGKDNKLPPIIISAHFDHLGEDFSSNIYSGALDNASGISFVLEMTKYIKSLGVPERNIIFIGFNAEEFGLLGSNYFVDRYKNEVKSSEVFNFDMIGSNAVPLSIVGGKNDNKNTGLIKDLSKICIDSKIKYNCLFEDASDHASFRKFGIDAVTFCDSDMSKIHTPFDKPQNISKTAIKNCFTVFSKELLPLAFKHNYFILYSNQIWMFSLGICITLTIFLIYKDIYK